MASEKVSRFTMALFNALGESNLKVPRLSHGIDPFEYWSREQIEQAIIDAAAAVDGDAQWNAAIEAAAQKAGAEFCGAFEGIGDDVATAIRSLKRLKWLS